MLRSLVGSEMCIRDSINAEYGGDGNADMRAEQNATRPRHSPYWIKIGMVGDTQTGKTTLRDAFIDGEHHVDFKQTMAVNFAERSEHVGGCDIKMSVWDFGGHMPDISHLEQVCEDAHAVLFVFDLCRPTTLASLPEWLQRVRTVNLSAMPVIVGTKYDQFLTLRPEAQQRTISQASSFAKVMEAPLIFCSSALRIHVNKVFGLVLSHLICIPPAFGLILPSLRSKGKRDPENYTPVPVLDYRDLAKRHDWQMMVHVVNGTDGGSMDVIPLEEKPSRRKRRGGTGRRTSTSFDEHDLNEDTAPPEC
eukprot:TRINITY_DN2389_c0_g1_i3.p1 TRINITY_DN2389_c0_g1~~TRINITY_DN2389_c0_g1_i3.p1  ORF type:complete len:306 (-),score=83.84 TRINITY_DN2389_c0_g1_i3:417-1334(-)